MGLTRRLFGRKPETIDGSDVCGSRRIYLDSNRRTPYCTCVFGEDFTDLKAKIKQYRSDMKSACLDMDQFSAIRIEEDGKVYPGCMKA